MSNPFEGLEPALELIQREAKVLSATGQAVEDLLAPVDARATEVPRTSGGGVSEGAFFSVDNCKPSGIYCSRYLLPVGSAARPPTGFCFSGGDRCQPNLLLSRP